MEHKPTVTDEDLARLAAERERADRAYNGALTALDEALPAQAVLPPLEAVLDTSQIERLNRLWQVVPPEPVPLTGWRGRLGAFVWRIAGPLFQRQQEFNAAMVEHANRNAASARESAESAAAFAATLADELRALSQLHSRLIGYLQQVTLYVDTKDRYETGLLWHELRLRTDGLAAGLSALGDQILKHREAMLASDYRRESSLMEFRRRLMGLEGRHGLEGRRPSEPGDEISDASTNVAGVASTPAGMTSRRRQLAGDGEANAYVGFEDLYRGATEEIQARLAEYVPLFESAGGPVVDLGCGRGEFLVALREQGLAGRGVDINASMVERSRSLGLDVTQAEALAYLSSLPDASLGGILASQLVEHLQPDELVQLIGLARVKLRHGGVAVLETVNPACWAAFFSSYIRDITHVRPIHPDTLRYLMVARGFVKVDVRFSSPYPLEAKLHALPLTLTSHGPALSTIVEEFNRNVEILNGKLFTHLDYAVVGHAD